MLDRLSLDSEPVRDLEVRTTPSRELGDLRLPRREPVLWPLPLAYPPAGPAQLRRRHLRDQTRTARLPDLVGSRKRRSRRWQITLAPEECSLAPEKLRPRERHIGLRHLRQRELMQFARHLRIAACLRQESPS